MSVYVNGYCLLAYSVDSACFMYPRFDIVANSETRQDSTFAKVNLSEKPHGLIQITTNNIFVKQVKIPFVATFFCINQFSFVF